MNRSAERQRWAAMAGVLAGTFMVALDQTIVAIALPQIGLDLDAIRGVEWVVTAYLLALAIGQPATGWLADRLGRKPVFLASLALFTIGSLLAGLAPNLAFLVGARVIQGLCGGAMFPVGKTMIYEQFPPNRRGAAMGIWSVGVMVAPAIGPVLGGVIVTHLDWRWLFFVNVPVGVLGVLIGLRVLPSKGYTSRRAFDGLGFGLSAVAFTAILIVISGSGSLDLGSMGLVILVVGVVALALFVRHELREPDPLIDLRMFAIGTFSVSTAVQSVLVFGQFARFVFVPLELEILHRASALDVGVVLTPAAIATAVAAPFAGRFADRIGSRPPVIIGLLLVGAGGAGIALASVNTPLWIFSVMVTIQGFGNGLAMTPNTVAGMNSLPQRLLASGTALSSLIRQLTGSMSVAALTAMILLLAGGLAPAPGRGAAMVSDAYALVFWIVLVVSLVGVGLATRLPHGAELDRDRDARAQDQVDFPSPGT